MRNLNFELKQNCQRKRDGSVEVIAKWPLPHGWRRRSWAKKSPLEDRRCGAGMDVPPMADALERAT